MSVYKNEFNNKKNINKKFDYEKKLYIDIDLHFFDEEKTEKPTPKKLEKARDSGQVAMSKEIATAVLFIFGFLAVKIFAGYMYDGSAEIFTHSFSIIEDIDKIFEKQYVFRLILFILMKIFLICLPVFAVVFVLGILTNVIQVGWHPTVEPLKPNIGNLSPLKGIKRMFSVKSLVEFVKSIFKLLFVGYVIYTGIVDEIPIIKTLTFMNVSKAFIYVGDLCVDLGIKVGCYFVIIAVADFAYQKFSHLRKLKMSKQEVKDEYKNVEGDPQVKGQIKQRMRQASMRRMMQQVPDADVIITNPTHYAVALKYDKEKADAPIVLAKGVDHLAKRIKDVAKESNVEIVENRPLARALYNTVDVGKQIPPELYQAVADVLAFVYNLKNKKV